MNSITWIFICLMGLCWGSFLNVLIVRTLSGESIVSPPSKCPKCEHQLYWWHNIPIVSFMLLQGKCYFCNKSISIRYPIVECLGLVIFIFAFLINVSFFDAVAVIFILSMFLVLSFTDVKEQKISSLQALLIIPAGLVFNRYDIFNSLTGAMVGAILPLLFIYIGKKFFNKTTFGAGDVYMLSALGSVVGGDKLFLFLIYALLIQFVLILPNYVVNLIRLNKIETLKYLIIFIITCLFLYVSRNISFMGSNVVIVCFFLTMLYFAYKLTKDMVLLLKTDETPAKCPLAPALFISCLLFLC